MSVTNSSPFSIVSSSPQKFTQRVNQNWIRVNKCILLKRRDLKIEERSLKRLLLIQSVFEKQKIHIQRKKTEIKEKINQIFSSISSLVAENSKIDMSLIEILLQNPRGMDKKYSDEMTLKKLQQKYDMLKETYQMNVRIENLEKNKKQISIFQADNQ